MTSGTAVLGHLDTLRASLLRETLGFAWARRIFSDRASRLLALYFLSVAIYLPLSLVFPLWVLAIGPMIWGIPHIFASFRYVGRAISEDALVRRRILQFATLIWAVTTGFRLYVNSGMWLSFLTEQNMLLPELISLVAVALGLSVISGFQWRKAFVAGAFVLPTTWLMWHLPVFMTGFLLLFHNWVAFYFWFQSARSSRERGAALVAFAAFALAHVLVFAGSFDFVFHIFAPEMNLSWAHLNSSEIGSSIGTWSQSASLWYHGVVLYAFGQSLHYFVWIKALGDQNLPSQAPASFRTTFNLLKQDFGWKILSLIVLVTGAVLLNWWLTDYALARTVYFAAASYHGFLELGAIPFARVNRS